MPSASFTTDAIVKDIQTGQFTLDAEVIPYRFTIDAWILSERWRHHRVRDHYGPESDLYVVLSSPIGKYAQGTPVHWVIDDLLTRLQFLEDWDRVRGNSFTMDAFLAVSGTYGQGIFTADAIVEATQTFTGSSGIKLDAYIITGGSFTIDAVLVPRFTIDAFIV